MKFTCKIVERRTTTNYQVTEQIEEVLYTCLCKKIKPQGRFFCPVGTISLAAQEILHLS
jgi:hypothetical protein